MSDKKFIYVDDLIIEIDCIETIILERKTIKFTFKNNNKVTSIFDSIPIAKNTFNRLTKSLCDA